MVNYVIPGSTGSSEYDESLSVRETLGFADTRAVGRGLSPVMLGVDRPVTAVAGIYRHVDAQGRVSFSASPSFAGDTEVAEITNKNADMQDPQARARRLLSDSIGLSEQPDTEDRAQKIMRVPPSGTALNEDQVGRLQALAASSNRFLGTGINVAIESADPDIGNGAPMKRRRIQLDRLANTHVEFAFGGEQHSQALQLLNEGRYRDFDRLIARYR